MKWIEVRAARGVKSIWFVYVSFVVRGVIIRHGLTLLRGLRFGIDHRRVTMPNLYVYIVHVYMGFVAYTYVREHNAAKFMEGAWAGKSANNEQSENER